MFLKLHIIFCTTLPHLSKHSLSEGSQMQRAQQIWDTATTKIITGKHTSFIVCQIVERKRRLQVQKLIFFYFIMEMHVDILSDQERVTSKTKGTNLWFDLCLYNMVFFKQVFVSTCVINYLVLINPSV